ncbi:PREDICTED: transcription initiation factor TFIID subunit 1b-like [Camelina sativa]|uniref:Transcription initiation factor TFIID subunit 1b-like n=1 Tax=Camelina sativa TaxID=90675 RepID=A0ABM1RS76_CAMSA|nr:PREDICTED: transcription initiation factor TFIID subunit 1b-like [Camelina sativa]
MKKKAAARCGVLSGTEVDLRRLSMEEAQEVLLKFNIPDEIIVKQSRRHRIAMIRKLSSEQVASGGKFDPTTIGKYACGQRISFPQVQQQTRQKCQEIWDRQRLSLSACDDDENESENDANSDLDSFVGDLEILLDAEIGGEGDESNMSKNEKVDGVNDLKMRRWLSQVDTDDEIEDGSAENAELCRLLMQDENHKKKKKMKAVGEGMRIFPPPRPTVEPVIDKKSLATQPDASFLVVNESAVKDTTNVDKAILKTPRGKQVKEISNPIGKLKNLKILKVFKGEKTARASFVCGACGQHGHMKTNRHCPKYRENTESHLKSIDLKKSAGKPSSSHLSGEVWLKPIENKKTAPKSTTKLSVNEAAKIGDSTSKTWGLPAGGLIDKRCSETQGNSELAAVSHIDTGTKLTSRVSKLNISSKEKPKDLKVASDSPSQSLRPAFSRKRRESESHNSSVSEKLLPSTEPNQATLSRHTISVPQLSLSMDKDQAESCRHHRAIWPPTEREHQQKKLVIQRSKEITDHDIGSLRDTPQLESRTTKRMADFQRQQRLRLSENFLDWGRKEERIFRKEQDISMDRHKEGNVRIDYNDIIVSEEGSEIAEIRRYEEVLWSENEEGKRQKATKKNMLQREIIEDYPRRRLSERGQNISSLCVSDIERNGEEYVPQPKRRKKGEVGLANILESIVDTLRAKVNVSYLFLKPVSKKEAPNYLDIVERPMDLSTIRDKVRRMEYSDRKQFRRFWYGVLPENEKHLIHDPVGLANILESIVDTLRAKVNVSYLFLKPVSKKEAPNYLDIVERPMDLSTIRDKVRRMEYSDRKQFRRDVWQIKYNAHLYNDGRNLEIPPLADELLSKCDRLLDEYRHELTEAEEGIASSHSY